MPTLTEAAIKKMEPPPQGQKIISDRHPDAPRGFGLRILPSGSKTFILRYSFNGRERRLTIGAWPTWSLTAARKEAGGKRREIDAGTDILAQRRRERLDPTVREAVQTYCEDRIDALASGAEVRRLLENRLVPALATFKLRGVRRRDLIALVAAVAQEHGRTAGRLLTYIKGLCAWAEDKEIIESNPAATIKPSRIAHNLTPVSRERVLTDAEIRAFWTGAETSGMHRLTALALKMVLATGQRPGEVAGMRWDEIDGKARLWTIPAARRGKTRTQHTVPLTDTAPALLEQAKAEIERLSGRRKVKPGDYVFEARPGAPVTTAALGKAVLRHAEALGNLDGHAGRWRPHDLRRTCRTHLAAAGVGDVVAEQVMGHTRKGIAGVYDRHTYEAEKRIALDTWERRLLRIVAGQPADGGNVVPLRRKGA